MGVLGEPTLKGATKKYFKYISNEGNTRWDVKYNELI